MNQAEIIEGLPLESYLALPALHFSALRQMAVSPRAFDFHEREPDELDTDALRVGRAGHAALLEPHRFSEDFVVWSGPRRAGGKWEEFKDAHRGRTILTETQYATALRCAAAIRTHPVASRYLEPPGRAELTILWTHVRTGVRIKCRVDWLGHVLVDVKTSRNPHPARFGSDAARYGYPMQFALYQDAVAAAGLGVPPTKLIAVQNVPPFDVVPFDVGPDVLEVGREGYEAALDRLLECRRTGTWPGLADEEVPLRLPAWAMPDFDDEPITADGVALF